MRLRIVMGLGSCTPSLPHIWSRQIEQSDLFQKEVFQPKWKTESPVPLLLASTSNESLPSEGCFIAHVKWLVQVGSHNCCGQDWTGKSELYSRPPLGFWLTLHGGETDMELPLMPFFSDYTDTLVSTAVSLVFHDIKFITLNVLAFKILYFYSNKGLYQISASVRRTILLHAL